MAETGPLSLGQLSVWHDIRDLPPARRHEPNNAAVWSLPAGTDEPAVRAALTALAARHPSLRTRYDLSCGDRPAQLVDEQPDIRLAVAGNGNGNTAAGALAGEAAAVSFDLGREHGWRAVLTEAGGDLPELVFTKHHILADAWAQEVLHRELVREITDPGTLVEPAAGPLDLATEQRTSSGARRRRAALEHWQRVTDRAPDVRLPRPEGTPDGVEQVTLRSGAAYTAAHALAGRTQVSVAAVVLAAYARAVARRCDTDTLLVQLMSANRFGGGRRDIVTSMNQWVPALVGQVGPDTGLPAAARAAYWSGLTAFRHGMHDVRETAAVAGDPGRTAPQCAFNHVAVPPAPGGVPSGQRPGPATLTREEPFTTIGPRCYARSAEEDGALSVRLTAKDLGPDECAALLWDLHDDLVRSAGRL